MQHTRNAAWRCAVAAAAACVLRVLSCRPPLLLCCFGEVLAACGCFCCCCVHCSHAYGRTSAPLFSPCEDFGISGRCSSGVSPAATHASAAAAAAPAAAGAAGACGESQRARGDLAAGRGPAWKLLLLDLRPQWLFEGGRLPPAIHVDALGDWKQTLPALVGAIDPATTGAAAATATDADPTRSSLSEHS